MTSWNDKYGPIIIGVLLAVFVTLVLLQSRFF